MWTLVFRYTQKADEGVGSPEAGLTGGCGLVDVRAGKELWSPRTAPALNHPATLPDPGFGFLFEFSVQIRSAGEKCTCSLT